MVAAPTIFTVHAGADVSVDPASHVPHRFAWGAFWLGPAWLVKHRLWLPAALVLVADVGILFALKSGALAPAATGTLWILTSILVGLEGQEWRRRALGRRGRAIGGYAYGVDESDAIARLAFERRNAVAGETAS